MLKVYPAIIHKEENNYWVEFPDLAGCQTYGETLEETMTAAEEALGLYLVALIEDNQELPKAREITEITATDGFTNYITTDVNKYRRNNKATKKTLSIPQWLNEEAEKAHINFSAVLQSALKERLGL